MFQSKPITQTFKFERQITSSFVLSEYQNSKPKQITSSFVLSEYPTSTPKQITSSFVLPKTESQPPKIIPSSFVFPNTESNKELTSSFVFQKFNPTFPFETPSTSFKPFIPFNQINNLSTTNPVKVCNEKEIPSIIENNECYSFLYNFTSKEKKKYTFMEETKPNFSSLENYKNTKTTSISSCLQTPKNFVPFNQTLFTPLLKKQSKSLNGLIKSQPTPFSIQKPNTEKKIYLSQKYVKPTWIQIFKLVCQQIKEVNKNTLLQPRTKLEWNNSNIQVFINNKEIKSGSWIKPNSTNVLFKHPYGSIMCKNNLNCSKLNIDLMIMFEKKTIEFLSHECNYKGNIIITLNYVYIYEKKAPGVTWKVSEKGALSVYGLGRFPVTLYKSQWEQIFDKVDEIKLFMKENESKLAIKDK